MSEPQKKTARQIIDDVVLEHGDEVFIGLGYAADEMLHDLIEAELTHLREALRIAEQERDQLKTVPHCVGDDHFCWVGNAFCQCGKKEYELARVGTKADTNDSPTAGENEP